MNRGFPYGVRCESTERASKRKKWRVAFEGTAGCEAAECDSPRFGIGLFIEEGAYTTLASAVAILVVLTLLFSSVTAIWSMSRAGDVQVAADATALAGANVVSSYSTAATVVDASILSLGLAGFCLVGVGLVGLLIPGVNAAAKETVDAGIKMLDMRNDFAQSASRGLQKLEESLPYLVAANSLKVCLEQCGESTRYTGAALVVPQESASVFSAIESDAFDVTKLQETSDSLDTAADDLAAAAEERARKNEAAWLADCGRDGMNMQERAARLSGLSAAENPDYASSITWDPNIALDRARAYYQWRYSNDSVTEGGDEGAADAAARHVFYGYACEVLADARVWEEDGVCCSNVELLPRNTSEVTSTHLYTDVMWPSTYENGKLAMHYSRACSGAKGKAGPLMSFAGQGGAFCSVCRFDVGDLGKTPAASTSIDNGFEYHLREFILALDEYVAARNHELELERAAQERAEAASSAFDEALSSLGGKRPRIAPPGRYGCVAAVVAGEASAPDSLNTSFAATGALSSRGAISAAVLAPDAATKENNVLSRFFSSFESEGGGGAAGLVNDVMGIWGSLLVGYGDMQESLDSAFGKLQGALKKLGLGKVGTWINEAVDGAVSGLGLQAVDLSLRKPVLVDSAKVLAKSDFADAANLQEKLRALPIGTTDPVALLQQLGAKVGDYIADSTFTLAEIPLPNGKKIPLKVKLRDFMGGGS